MRKLTPVERRWTRLALAVVVVALAGLGEWYVFTRSTPQSRVRVGIRRQAVRRVSPERRLAILAVLREEVPERPIKIVYPGGNDTEPEQLARALAAILQEAGWSIFLAGDSPAAGPAATGLIIRLPEPTFRPDALEEPPRRAVLLRRALAAGLLEVRMLATPVVQAGVVELLVGISPARAPRR